MLLFMNLYCYVVFYNNYACLSMYFTPILVLKDMVSNSLYKDLHNFKTYVSLKLDEWQNFQFDA